MQLESWRTALRDGFIPNMSTVHLLELRDMLRRNDPRLTQGSTCTPPPLMCVADWPVEACCLVALGGVAEHGGFGHAKVGEAEEAFAELCYQADVRLGDPAACRYLLNWFDDTPRDEMIRELLPEIERALREREAASATVPPPSAQSAP